MISFLGKKKYLAIAILCAGLFSILYFELPDILSAKPEVYEAGKTDSVLNETGAVLSEKKIVQHIKTPEHVKTIYMTQCVVGTKPFRESLVKIAEETEINSIIIDIKDYTGRIAFLTDHPLLSEAVSNTCGARDMKEFIEYIHSKGIYVIGRVTVFQDPFMTAKYPERAVQSKSTGKVWKDYKGISFIDVGSREHWDYTVALAKESYEIGFDEVNFDYIRYPSDGKMDDVLFKLSDGGNKPEELKKFFVYLHDKLQDTGLVTSADLFGMTTTSFDDLNIGQILENTLPYFDYVAPMVYPSHYPKNFNGWKNPNNYVYEIVNFAMSGAVKRANALDTLMASTTAINKPNLPADYNGNLAKKLRTWIQDFDYGGNYDVAEVKAQIKASYDAGVMSWMIWNPSNKYTIGALEKE